MVKRLTRSLWSPEVLVFLAVLTIGSALGSQVLHATCNTYRPTGCHGCAVIEGDTYCSDDCSPHFLCSKTDEFYFQTGDQYCFDICAVGWQASCPGLCDF